jgi:hypothetical protein
MVALAFRWTHGLDPEQVEWVWVWPGGCGSGRKRVGETHACTHDNVDPSRSGFGWVVSRIPDDPERFHGFTDNEEDNSDDDDVLTAYPFIYSYRVGSELRNPATDSSDQTDERDNR